MKIEHTARISISNNTTFQDIQDAIDSSDVPPTAKVKVDHWAGDQRDPSYTNLIFNWETGS